MDVKQIITDPTLSPEAKVILVTAEIERAIRGIPPDIEVSLVYEDVPFLPYIAPFLPRVGEIISCQVDMGKGEVATLWKVTQIEHDVRLDRLMRVSIRVVPADTQTAMRL
jgi:hypothetical protein